MKINLVQLMFVWFMMMFSGQVNAEDITVITYYPSPYGIYQRLRLEASDTIDPLTACINKGEMYYDDSDSLMYVCDGSDWQAGQGYWTSNVSDVYPNDTNWNLGIGTNSPSEKLHVVGNIQSSGDFTISGVVTGVTLDCINVQSASGLSGMNKIYRSISCPAGYVITGGGANCVCGPAEWSDSLITYSQVEAPNSWNAGCTIEPTCPTHKIYVYARCCRLK